ncbi:kinase-like domain-containing protein [Rhizophagus irregularis DAOM 181602=DAOM 197198]|nr:kinase-like domain-containing protein [Rhizophagus irregularis DAOM 181602=DAOM 197198]
MEFLTKNFPNLTIFEWIPYDKFIEIEKIEESDFATAIWKDGPLSYDKHVEEWIRASYEEVILRILYDSENITDEFINKVKSYLFNEYSYSKVDYGISQNPDTRDYILVFSNEYFDNHCQKCEMGKSGFSVAIWEEGPLHYDVVEKKWMKESYKTVVLKYLSNLQNNITDEFLNEATASIDKTEGNCLTTATWEKGPLIYDTLKKEWVKTSYKKVCLRYLYNSQNVTNEFIDKVESYLTDEKYYGVSQNSNTRDYILVFNNEYFDYHCEKCGGIAIAIWEDGPLYYSNIKGKYKRKLNKKVLLKYLYNSQNINDTLLSKVAASIMESYGISQNPNTKEFILVLRPKNYCENCGKKYNNKFEIDNKNCMSCQTNHENKKISDLIQEMRLDLDHSKSNTIFEWIPYDQFDDIREIDKVKTYSNRKIVHCYFHMGNILFTKLSYFSDYKACISDMGLYRKIDDINETKIYGVIPFVAPEVLKEKSYTREADIFSFGMIMYVVATGRRPFDNCAHDECWDGNPDNRPNSIEIKEMIELFYNSLDQDFKKKEQQHYEIEEQFKETQESRKESLLSIKNGKSTTHAQAIYTSRLLNPFTKNISNSSTVEITDFKIL